jgi:hypothetical protein
VARLSPARSAFSAFLLVLLVCAAVAAPAAQRDRAPSVGITVFEDVNFGGRYTSFVRDIPDLRRSAFDKRISSFIIAPGEVWEMCDSRNFSGRCEAFSGREPDLVRRKWNDKIQSLRLVRNGGPTWRLELFAGTRYSGQRFVIDGPTADFSKTGFNDRAMSVRVPAGQSWEVCINANYDQCSVIDHDVPDLALIGLTRLISSARPHTRGR